MKKHRILSTVLFIAVLALAAFSLVACGDKTEKTDYSVTVMSADNEPIAGVTVIWNTKSGKAGSAVTGEDGKATASLSAGTYTVELSGIDASMTYTSISVNAQMSSVILTLEVKTVEYSATVTDKNGQPAKDVTVSWSDGVEIVGTATTDSTGKAVCELKYGDYTVTVADLPSGNVYDGALETNGQSPAVNFNLKAGTSITYTVTLKSEGGLIFKNHSMRVYKDNLAVFNGKTNDNGVFSFNLSAGVYSVRTTLPDGYALQPVTLDETTTSATMIAKSAVINDIPAYSVNYVMGDIIHNYSFETPYTVNGKKISLKIADVLKEKDALIINNWGTGCSWCVREMPAMQEAYEKYKDDIEIIAVSNYNGGDSDTVITNYYNQYQYTFPMMRDRNGLAAKFSLSNWPATIVIDRYGAIARIEKGAVLDAEIWGRMIEKYIGKDYVQDFVPGDQESDSITNEVSKPDVVLDPDHYDKVAAAMNKTDEFPAGASVTWFGETEYEYAWPFVLGTDETVSPDETVMYSSNSGKPNSMSIIYATVNVAPGKVFTFDYWAQTQSSDILSIVWDGKIIKQIYGNSNGWQTCYLYSDITEGSHSLGITYIKDSSGNSGKDNVYFRRVRFVNVDSLTKSTDMLRAAAYGSPAAGATTFPYYAKTEVGEDGYYRVKLSELENSQFAGNDASPMLFVNLMNVTNWASTSINKLVFGQDEDTGEYLIDCTLTVNGVTRDYRDDLIKYMNTANSSDIHGFMPVDRELHDLLVAFMAKVSGSDAHKDEWLEACYFYSHYGDGSPIGNPILGLTPKTAIPVHLGKNTADMTRYLYPFTSTIYTFTPEESGLYEIKSLIPDKDSSKYAAQIWLYDDSCDAEHPLVHDGDTRFIRDGKDEQNFTVYRYMTAGHKYYLELAFLMQEVGTYDFTITRVEGDTKTVLLPCSSGEFGFILDENDEITDEFALLGAVEYVKDDDGYYHVKNADGSLGSFIYFDVKYPTKVTPTLSISQLVDQYLKIPQTNLNAEYKVFDFRRRIIYMRTETEDGTDITFDTQFDLTQWGDEYTDYTDIMKNEYIAKAEDNDGLVKVDDRLVKILTLFIEVRVNSYIEGEEPELALENEWLRFCWYYRTYDSENL